MRPYRPILLALSLALAPAALAQSGKAKATLWSRAEGDRIRAAIQIEIEPGWHLYHTELGNPDAVGKPTVLTLAGDGIAWSPPRFPEPETLIQEGLAPDGGDGWIWGHHGTLVVFAAGRRAAGAPAAPKPTAKISGLTCKDGGSCIPYHQTLTDSGPGPDAVFAAFPDDLEAPAPEQRRSRQESQTGPVGNGGGGEPAADAAEWTETAMGHVALRLFARSPAPAGSSGASPDGPPGGPPGGNGLVRAVLQMRIEDGWHVYHTDVGPPDAAAKPLELEFLPADVHWSPPLLPEPEVIDQSDLGTWAWGHHGTIAIRASGAPAIDPARVAVHVKGLTCKQDGSCLPIDVRLEAQGPGPNALFADFPAAAGADLVAMSTVGPPGLSPGAGTGPDAGVGSDATPDAPPDATPDAPGAAPGTALPAFHYEPRESSGLGSVSSDGGGASLLEWMFFAFVAGMILNVMPCVLPVVSIKVLSFVNQAGESRGRVLALGLAFSAGILSVFLVLGILAATAGLAWGEQFQSTTFLVVMIGIVFGFALSLFGLFELGVPRGVGELAGREQQREGLLGAFTMGILSTLLATPCSGPFLGSTLAWAVTQKQAVVVAIFAMAGLGMAAPYAVLTSNPALLKYVPKPGPWMETFKHAMGFLLLFTVLFLMASVPSGRLLATVTFLVFVGLACWIWGRFATFDQSPGRRLATLGWAVLALAGGGWLSFVGLPRFFAPGEIWEDFDLARLERYHEEGRNVFLDFTANWCATCKTNEKVVYESEPVEKLLRKKNVVAMKVDLTEGQPDLELKAALRDALGSKSIPFAAIFPGDDPYRPWTMRDLVTREQVTRLLQALP